MIKASDGYHALRPCLVKFLSALTNAVDLSSESQHKMPTIDMLQELCLSQFCNHCVVHLIKINLYCRLKF